MLTRKAFVCKAPVRISGDWKSWFSDEAIVTFAALCSIGTGLHPIPFVTNPTTLASLMFNTEYPTKQERKYFKQGLNDLYEIDNRWLEPLNPSNTQWRINPVILFEPYENNNYVYSHFCFYELHFIEKYTEKNVLGAMAFYIKFKSIFDRKYDFKIEHFTQDEMVKCFSLAKNTIRSYLKKYEELDLICRYTPKKIKGNGNHFLSLSNVYYLPGYLKQAEEYAEIKRTNYIAAMNSNEQSQSNDLD